MHTQTEASDFLDTPILPVRHDKNSISEILPDFCSENYRAHKESESPIDYRIRQLSYSSLLTLHQCPRKFQLYKLRSSERRPETTRQTVTFSFGHVFGEAIQGTLANLPYHEIMWKMFLRWKPGLFEEDEKAKKSFWFALMAFEKFYQMHQSGFLKEYELATFNGKPAVELSFAVVLPDGFRIRGYVDAVLVHKETREVIVLEIKHTGSANFSPTQFKNSAQGIGYSIVLDVLFPELSSYTVLYLVYQTKSQEFTPIPFTKLYLQRAVWIKELLLDIEMIKTYEEHSLYPMRGESCYDYYSDCEYLNSCQLSTSLVTKPFDPEKDTDTEVYQINLTLMDLIDAQLSKIKEVEDAPQ